MSKLLMASGGGVGGRTYLQRINASLVVDGAIPSGLTTDAARGVIDGSFNFGLGNNVVSGQFYCSGVGSWADTAGGFSPGGLANQKGLAVFAFRNLLGHSNHVWGFHEAASLALAEVAADFNYQASGANTYLQTKLDGIILSSLQMTNAPSLTGQTTDVVLMLNGGQAFLRRLPVSSVFTVIGLTADTIATTLYPAYQQNTGGSAFRFSELSVPTELFTAQADSITAVGDTVTFGEL